MANKEALLDLQQRLAERLQSAQADGDASSWLAVRIGNGQYLFPLSQSGEIFPVGAITRVPYTQSWFSGVVNLRGGLYGVVDLMLLLQPQATARDEAAWAQARLVTLNVDLGVNCALLVDALAGLRRQDAFNGVQPAPEGSPDYFGSCLIDAKGTSWQEINLLKLAHSPAFLDISA